MDLFQNQYSLFRSGLPEYKYVNIMQILNSGPGVSDSFALLKKVDYVYEKQMVLPTPTDEWSSS